MRQPCLLCMHWVEDAIIGETEALRLLAEHKRAEHGPPPATFPPESGLFVLPPACDPVCRTCHTLPCVCPQDVIAVPSGAVQSDAAALDARAVAGARLPGGDIPAAKRVALCATDGHIVRDGRCAWCGGAPSTASRPSVTFDGDTWDEVRAAVRVWLAGEDAEAAVQAPGKEGRS